MAYTGTDTAQGAAGTWTSATRNSERDDRITGSVYSDLAGTLYIEQGDGTIWDVSTSYTVPAADGKGFSEEILRGHWRVRFTYTGTQATFRCHAKARSAGDS